VRGDGKVGWLARLVALVLEPLLLLATRRRWSGLEHIPTTGGAIVAVNHNSYVDPLALMHFVYRAGRWPHFLSKAELFRIPVFGRVIRALGQIPVHRGTANASDALRDARTAIERGECVVIYPEGTVTRDPDYWPMVGRTGAVRLALETGAPVIPVAQWGAQEILGHHGRPRLLPRRTVSVVAGPPVDLSAYDGDALTGELLREATDEVMNTVRRQLGEIRGERPPTVFFDPMAALGAGAPAQDPDRRPA
jgi:1-acyl-sn-glycerol-3-phosphate acyltransferase